MFDYLFEKNENISLLIDIGNGSIAGAAASFSENEKPKILYSIRKAFDISDIQDNVKLLENMYSLLNEILKDITKNGTTKTKKFSNVLVSFSSPWFILQTKNINISQDKPFIITKAFIDDVIDKQEVLFKKEYEIGKEKKLHTHTVTVLDKVMISSKLNGYALQNNVGKKTKIFDATMCLSVISKSVANKICSIITKQTGAEEEKIKMHSFPLISFIVVRDFFATENDFLIMDVTGETTDLTLVIDGNLIKNISFPSGRNFIIRQIAKKFDISAEIAESMFHLYILEKIDDENKNRIYEILTNIENEWSIYLEDAFSDLSPNMVLPSKIFLTADLDVASFYSDCIRLPKNDKTSAFRKNVNIVHIDKEIFSHVYKNNPRMQKDEFIGLLAIFYNQSRK